MKPLVWLGDSRKALKEFPEEARNRAGFELWEIQHGNAPSDWKPIPSIGPGVNEIRIHAGNEYRIIYLAKFAEAVYVLHAFTKKTRRTPKQDLDLAARRYRELLNERKRK